MSDEQTVVGILQSKGFEVLSRDEWHTQFEPLYQKRRNIRPFHLPAKDFFAHITVTFDSGNLTGDFRRDVRLVEQIGWDRFKTGISYTWLVDKRSGLIAKGHPIDACGAHTLNDKNVPGFPSNLNEWGHAIAWIGVPENVPSDLCVESYAAIMAASKIAGVAKGDANIYPHSKFAAKDCPSRMRNRLDDVRELHRKFVRNWS